MPFPRLEAIAVGDVDVDDVLPGRPMLAAISASSMFMWKKSAMIATPAPTRSANSTPCSSRLTRCCS